MSNVTAGRPLSYWPPNHPAQFKHPYSDFWPSMKMRAQATVFQRHRNYGKVDCNSAHCDAGSCSIQNCSCACHYSAPNQNAMESTPLAMAGIRIEPQMATHPAVAIRRYLAKTETGDGRKEPNNLPSINKSNNNSGNPSYLPTYNFSSECAPPQMWFARRPKSSVDTNERLKTPVLERAKTGFRYWYLERPKPTKFGRYSIGSKYTQMGLGFAPRS